jgi:hypothetical protein
MRISILVDLLRIPAHDTASHYAFGASFAPSFEWDVPETPETPPPDVFSEDLNGMSAQRSRRELARRAGPLVPWSWSSKSIQVWVDEAEVPAASIDLISLPRARDVDGASLEKIEKKLVAHCVAGVAKDHPAEFPNWHPLLGPLSQSSSLPANAFVYPAFLQSAAGLPAPVPHGRFNFVSFFRLEKRTVPGADAKILAAPIFSTDGQAFDQFRPPVEIDGRVVIPYRARWNSALVPDLAVEARCPAIPVDLPDSSDSFIDLNSLWVRPKLPGGWHGTVLDSWFEELPARLGAGFDLAARIVEGLGKEERRGPGTPLRNLRQAIFDQIGNVDDKKRRIAELTVLTVLRALHDRLGPSAQADSGSPLALLQRLLPNALSEQETVTLLSNLSPMLAALLTNERQIAAWNASDPRGMSWLDRLARHVGPIVNLPKSGPDFVEALFHSIEIPDDASKPFLVSRLGSVVAATSTSVLANILADLWGEAARNAGSLTEAIYTSLEGQGLRARLLDALVDTRMRRALLELAWTSEEGLFKRTSAGANDIAALTDNAVRSAGDYALGVLTSRDQSSGCEDLYQQAFTRTALLSNRRALREAIESETRFALGDLQQSLVSGAAQIDATKPVSPNAAPGGITIQFDRLVRGPKPASTGDDDFNRNLAGYGFLARRRASVGSAEIAEAWRCLSLVNLTLDETGFDPLADGTGPIETIATLVPTYDGDLPTAAVHYDNAPIVGRAHLNRRSDPDPDVHDPGTNLEGSPPLVSPAQPLPSLHGDLRSEAAKLPFLAFGVDVEVVAFAQTNHGALPLLLTEQAGADAFPGLLPMDRNNLTVPVGGIRRIPYRRRVGIGSLKLSEEVARHKFVGGTPNPFSIPAGVRMMSDELELTGRPTDSAIDLGKPHQRPLARALLLHGDGGRPEGEFDVFAPSADVEVFDRWIAYDEFQCLLAGQSARQRLIRDYRKAIRDLFDAVSLDREKDKEPDKLKQSIGDPAVECLIVRATCVFREGRSVRTPVTEDIVAPWAKSLDQLMAKPTIADTHRDPIKIRLEISDIVTHPRLSFDGVNKVVLLVKKGEVWKVELAAGVAQSQIQRGGRFYEEILDGLPKVGNYFAAAPFSFALEAGTRDLPDETEIYESFVPTVGSDGRINFAWRRKASVADAAMGTVEIGWQQWRSTGRPAAPFPYDALGDLDNLPNGQDNSLHYPINWEVEAFADRPEEPSRARRFEPRLAPDATRGGTTEIQLGDEMPSPAMPARYIRFAITAENRYARAYEPTIGPKIGKISQGSWSTSWKRLFRSARPSTVKPLSVRALIPLTRSPRDRMGQVGSLGAALLVVEGAVGEAGGLAESIEARPLRIVRMLDQGQLPAKRVAATEFAADPLRRTQGLQPSHAQAATDLRLVGPIGHTFDFEAMAPAFQSSSYMILPPAFTEEDPGAGWMARIRVRRVLEPRAVAGFGDQVKLKSASENVSVPLGLHGDTTITFENLSLDAPRSTASIDWYPARQGDPAAECPTIKIRATAHGTGSKVDRVEFSFEDANGTVSASVSEKLRSLRLLVTRRRIDTLGLPVDIYEATLEAEGESGLLIRAGETTFEDTNATGAVEMVVTDAPVNSRIIWLCAALASEWTDTGWTQFLPDTSVHIRGSTGQAVTLELAAADNAKAVVRATQGAPLWHPLANLLDRSNKDDQGLLHFMMLMQTIESFAGRRRDEAYLGLYALNEIDPNGDGKFVPFGDIVDLSAVDPSKLRARILTVEADPRVWRFEKKNKTKTELKNWVRATVDEWEKFFPIEATKGQELAESFVREELMAPADAELRILTVWAPFEFQKTT